MTGSDVHDAGPQHPKEDRFTARMRLHQSRYRARVLGVPCGTGPRPSSKRLYGNMLRFEDAARGLNFLDPRIFEVVGSRLESNVGVVEEFRLLGNMLSSQPMCFNLFGLMAHETGKGLFETTTRLWRAVLGDEVRRVTRVCFEEAPKPRSEYLNDHTAFDAFVEYEHAAGGLAFAGIETKLTEPFSQNLSKPRNADLAYHRWVERGDSPWTPGAFTAFRERRHHQLFRDHLLAFALSKHTPGRYRFGRLMLVSHDLDEKCAATARAYRALQKPGDDTFVERTLSALLDAWSAAGLPDDWLAWERAFRLRYLDLEGLR